MAYKGVLFLLTILLLSDCYLLVRVKKFSLSDGNVPEKGRDISMSCEVEISGEEGILALNILKGDTKIADCFLNVGNLPCSTSADLSTRYKFSNNQPYVIISITNLQIADGGNWYCGFQQASNTLFTLMVYSSPVSVVLSGSSVSDDLSIKKVDLICKTSNCVYPAPGNIQWFYRKEGDSWFLYRNSTVIPAQTTCSGSERIYSSTLSLARNTVWPIQPTNTDTTVKFQCRLDFPTLTTPLVSNESNNVRYAVQVTSVVLKDGNKNLSSSETITIASGSSKLFTCTTSTSRPSSTIVWYIGSTSQQKNTSTDFRYTAAYEDNNKNIYCKAFNFQNETNAVSSLTPRLNVLVKVTSVILAEGNSPINNDVITVTQNQLKTFTCKTGETNPTAIIMWYVGNNLIQNGTDKNYSFTPTNADHDKIISCKAYNTQPPEFIESAKPKLFVQVPALLPSLTNWTSGSPEFYSGDQITVTCKSTPTRPAVNVIWKKGTTQLQNVQNVTSEDTTRLFTVTSTVTFTPQKNDNGSIISCEMYITNQTPQKLTKSIVVWWPPSSASIPTNSFPWLEGQQNKILTCQASDYGNPCSDILWKSSVGTPMSKTLRFPVLTQDYNGKNVSCWLSNKYTKKIDVTIHSPEIQLNIMYKPDVFIRVENKLSDSVIKNEGENLTAICSASGNPTPSVTWHGKTPGSTTLLITNINETAAGVYRCSAKASSSHFPLYDFSNETTLKVRVNSRATIKSFYAQEESSSGTVIVNENTEVHLVCSVESKSDSTIELLFQDKTLNRQKHSNNLTNIHHGISCMDAGVYTCRAWNQYNNGDKAEKQLALNVMCSPRPLYQVKHNFTSPLFNAVTLNFTALAYPVPGKSGFQWHKENRFAWSPLLSNADVIIASSGVHSNLTIKNVSMSDYGNYRVTVTNSIGTYKQYMTLTDEGQRNKKKNKESPTGSKLVAGIIVLGLFCAAFALYAIVVTILLKQKLKLKEVHRKSPKNRQKHSTYENQSFCNSPSGMDVNSSRNDAVSNIECGDEAFHEYTDLERLSSDDQKTYEIIKK